MTKPVLTEKHIRSQTAFDINGNDGHLKGKCCPECKRSQKFSITILAFGYLTDGGLHLNSGQEDRIGPAHCVSCCNGNGCAWTGHYRDLETIDADEWPEFKEGDRVISYGSRQNSGWSFSWECCVYVAKQRRRDGVVTWRREGEPFHTGKQMHTAKKECLNKQMRIERDEGVKLRIMTGIKRGTVILNSQNATEHLLRGGNEPAF